jgi:hypothetical protein
METKTEVKIALNDMVNLTKSNTSQVVETKKKRGRKPKGEDKDEKVDKTDETALLQDNGEAVTEKKKRGRKPKSVYSLSEVPVNVVNTNLSDDENVIVRLHVNDDEETDTSDDPHAYNNDKYSTMEYLSMQDDKNCHCVTTCNSLHVPKKDLQRIVEPLETVDSNSELKVVDILKDFEEKNKNNEWPSNTSISCYWCCHKFDNAPYGIPVNYQNGFFEVYGCFCSLECAAAYNFKSTESLDEIWERYNLLNLLSRKINYGRIVRAAPDRLTLKSFGGFLDIDAFRKYNGTNKIVNINFPPMTSLTQQIEEINEYELNSDLKYIPLDSERINRCKEKMIFKRTKPIINEKTTLESSMNLKISV